MSQIRIIAGKWRARKLTTLNLPELKPTSNRVRETLFNWLMFSIADTHCLDAFAGSGVLGLEALSRGASQVSFCETNTKLIEQLRATIAKLDCKMETDVLASNFLKTHFSKKFDLIFLDPPFHQDLVPACLEKTKFLLNPEGLIYLETEANFQLKTDYEILKSKHAGKVNFYLLKKCYNKQMEIKIYKKSKRLDLIIDAKVEKSYTIGIGKNEEGHKEIEGDFRTPEGEYKIIVKNPQSKFHLSLGLNYPNAQDAKLGFDAGRIDKESFQAICDAHTSNGSIPWKTPLGGEIFIHGDYENKTWSEGCIRMLNKDIEELYSIVPIGTKVFIYPK